MSRVELLQGTLELLILKTLTRGSMHGYAIARRIEQATDDVLSVEEGSLYPALHRMERRGWVKSEWGLSENKRKAKYYRMARAGQKQLETEESAWLRFADAVTKVLTVAEKGAKA